MLKKNQVYRATVTGFTSDGLGVCRVEGCAVFVPNAAPEEEYDLRIEHIGKTAAYGKIVSIITRSPARVNRSCPYAKQCGGCDFWHLTYEAECQIKKQRVLDALNRIGGQSIEDLPLTGAKTCYSYRNKVQFPVAEGKAGFYKKGSHDLIPIDHCLIQPECADRAREAVLQWMKECHVPSYEESTHKGLIRHIFVRYGEKTGQILVCLVCNGTEIPKKKRLIELLCQIPGMTSIAMNVNTRKGNAIMGDMTKTLWGADGIEDILCGLRFRISPRSFYQVNRDQAEILYEKAIACAELQGTETVMDLYCGTGTITLCLAKKAMRVIGVEVIDAAIVDAKKNAEVNGIENAEFFCADAGEAAKKLSEEGTRPDVIVVDPPRKGLSIDVIEAIDAMSPKKVVYVSCDPATLARDVKLLCERGYTLNHAEAVDLFPRCSHIESVVCLSREKANAPGQNFRAAQLDDAEQVLSLYQSAKSSAFCVWNDYYPTIVEIKHDLETKNLYVMTDGSKVIGSISVVPENELDSFDCWSCKEGKEIARVVIDKAYQGHGLSFEMVQSIATILHRNGCKAIHLSVVKSNTPAYKTYIKAGFAVVGETQMYGNDYYLMEKAIDTKF